jgi:acetyl esterase
MSLIMDPIVNPYPHARFPDRELRNARALWCYAEAPLGDSEITSSRVALEPAAQGFADTMSVSPFQFDLRPTRQRVDGVRSDTAGFAIDDFTIPGGPSDGVSVRLLREWTTDQPLPVILYIHGAGWVSGSRQTHDRLIRELAVGTGAAIVLPHYSLSPEAAYPTAIEENYTVLRWVAERGAEIGLDGSRIAVAGDSIGGNLAIALTFMAKQRSGPALAAQALFYPATDARFDTQSYVEFAEGHFLRRDAMQWFWDLYTSGEAERAEITASPLRATPEQLSGLPKALVITAGADILRDEGEAYAGKLRQAAVDVTATRYESTIHHFMMLDALRDTNGAKAAMTQAITFLRDALQSQPVTTVGPA